MLLRITRLSSCNLYRIDDSNLQSKVASGSSCGRAETFVWIPRCWWSSTLPRWQTHLTIWVLGFYQDTRYTEENVHRLLIQVYVSRDSLQIRNVTFAVTDLYSGIFIFCDFYNNVNIHLLNSSKWQFSLLSRYNRPRNETFSFPPSCQRILKKRLLTRDYIFRI